MQNEDKFKKISNFYAITHKLKMLIRSGWKQWNVDADRFESVAEHIYGCQMLAFAVNSEFNLNLDIEKVIFMFAFHELGEAIVGDITPNDAVPKEQKHQMEVEAVKEIAQTLEMGEKIIEIFKEYLENKTKEAKFTRLIDKVECNMQVKYYEEKGCTDLFLERDGLDEELRQKRISAGDKTFAEMWINIDIERNKYPPLFQDFAKYIINNNIFVDNVQLDKNSNKNGRSGSEE